MKRIIILTIKIALSKIALFFWQCVEDFAAKSMKLFERKANHEN